MFYLGAKNTVGSSGPERIAPSPDGPLRGIRETIEFLDSCTAIRRRRSSLVVPNGQPVAARVDGDAIDVLHTVVADWPA